MKKKNHVVPLIPIVSDAVQEYEALGGSLTRSNPFGIDLLESSPVLKERRQELFHSQYPQFDAVVQKLQMDIPIPFSNFFSEPYIPIKCTLYSN